MDIQENNITDDQIEHQRVQGDILLVLENGTPEEKQSMGRLFKFIRPDDYKEVLESYGIELYE